MSDSTTVNQQILSRLRALYEEPGGIIDVGKLVDMNISPPREKITVLIIGNHSAGKSSFINWYIEESLLRQSVAMETSGIIFVTSGKKKERLGGQATVQAFPHIKPLAEAAKSVSCITAEISTSKQKRFPLVTFVDTPGLVDGEMEYPFDVDEALLWLGRLADCILIFFDPIGQALCRHTLDLVERMHKEAAASNPRKLRFYLSKADQAGTDVDRQRVLVQITQNLCRRPGLNNIASEIPAIHIPNMLDQNKGKPSALDIPTRLTNQIDDVVEYIDDTINQMVQNSLNQFKDDCKTILKKIDEKIDADVQIKASNKRNRIQFLAFGLLATCVPLLALLWAVGYFGQLICDTLLGDKTLGLIFAHIHERIDDFRAVIPAAVAKNTLTVFGIIVLSFLMSAWYWYSIKPALKSQDIAELKKSKETIKTTLDTHHDSLYKMYLGSTVGNIQA